MLLVRFLRRSQVWAPYGLRYRTSLAADPDIQYPLEKDPPPAYIAERIALFDRLKAEDDVKLASRPPEPIRVELPDGRVMDGQSWETTPYMIASTISKGLADSSVVARVNGQLWDLTRPFEGSSTLELLKFDDKEGTQVFWHSSAHILGEAMELHYGGRLCYGPPSERGFHYDMHMMDRTMTPDDHTALNTLMKRIVKEKQPFVRLEMTREDLLEMFRYNKFKCHVIRERVTTPTTTVYRCGSLIDLCLGPHIPHTGKVKSIEVIHNSASQWQGKQDAESLQRAHGISFPGTKQMKEYKHFREEAARRDHRKLGEEQELFFFNALSQGSCFFLPNGTHIYNTLVDFIRGEYRRRGFSEVKTPNIYNLRLFERSGHWEHYADNMFSFDVDTEKYALKPMNCPGHCLMFAHKHRSLRDLPVRFADFGVLHRAEISGALSGLTRVRRFQQDDAHIFCTVEQIQGEMRSCLEFLKFVYGVFGFTFDLVLSTRPEDFLGDAHVWDQAEAQLKTSLTEFAGDAWSVNEGDGAFYGPKIDIVVKDALQRHHQCATIQLDFQLAERFDLKYRSTEDDSARPVIIHRAILGSVERMIAILTEHFGGKWPFWLSPFQVSVVPVSAVFNDYAEQVVQRCVDSGLQAAADLSTDTMNMKVRNAQLRQFNYVAIVGQRELDAGTVNIRTRDNTVHGAFSMEDFLDHCKQLKQSRSNDSDSVFSK